MPNLRIFVKPKEIFNSEFSDITLQHLRVKAFMIYYWCFKNIHDQCFFTRDGIDYLYFINGLLLIQSPAWYELTSIIELIEVQIKAYFKISNMNSN